MSTLVRPDIKASTKKLTEILKEKYSIEIKHGTALEILALAHGFRDWNTMSAMLEKPGTGGDPSGEPTTVGELRHILQSVPGTTPLFAEYEYQEDNFDHEGGYSAQGRKRTQSFAAYKFGAEFILQFDDPNTWETLRETSRSFPGGPTVRTGLDADELSKFVQQCGDKINERDGLRWSANGDTVYLTRVFEFVEDDEIHEHGGRDLADQFGVSVAYSKHDGWFVTDDNGPKIPPGDKEGFFDELKMRFRDRSDHAAFEFFKKFGFSNQTSEWKPDGLLHATAEAKITDYDIHSNLHKLMSAIEDFPFNDDAMDAAADRFAQIESDLRRGK